MGINFNQFKDMQKYTELDEYLKSLITGRELIEIAQYNEREFILREDEAKDFYDNFADDIDALGSENEVRQEVSATFGLDDEELKEPANQELITLALVNDALHLRCSDLYEALKNKITTLNQDQSLAAISAPAQKIEQGR